MLSLGIIENCHVLLFQNPLQACSEIGTLTKVGTHIIATVAGSMLQTKVIGQVVDCNARLRQDCFNEVIIRLPGGGGVDLLEIRHHALQAVIFRYRFRADCTQTAPGQQQIAAKEAHLLNEDDISTIIRRRHSRNETCHAAASDDDLRLHILGSRKRLHDFDSLERINIRASLLERVGHSVDHAIARQRRAGNSIHVK